eukprot:746332-Hanusia_phi.AAC.23
MVGGCQPHPPAQLQTLILLDTLGQLLLLQAEPQRPVLIRSGFRPRQELAQSWQQLAGEHEVYLIDPVNIPWLTDAEQVLRVKQLRLGLQGRRCLQAAPHSMASILVAGLYAVSVRVPDRGSRAGGAADVQEGGGDGGPDCLGSPGVLGRQHVQQLSLPRVRL